MEVLFFLLIAFGSCRRDGCGGRLLCHCTRPRNQTTKGKKEPPPSFRFTSTPSSLFPRSLSGKQHTHTRRREEKEEVLIPPSSRSQGIWSGRRERRKTRKVQRGSSSWSPCSPPPPYCLLFFSLPRIATKEKEEERSPPKEKKKKKRRGDVETHCTKGKKEEGEKVSLHLLPYLRTFSLFKNYLFPQVEKEQQRSHKRTRRRIGGG